MTGPISQDTAHRIWVAHNQIEVGRKLLDDIAQTIREGGDPTPADPHNRHRRGYTLGLPHGVGERIIGVSPNLAAAVIEAHIAEKHRDLIEATLAAKIELEAAP